MSKFTNNNDIYSKPLLSGNSNREENFLIDALGNWIPECELIYYGLLNSQFADALYKLKNTSIFNPHDIYLDTCYFNGDDLIRYLASPDDTLENLSEASLNDMTKAALDKYFYVPCSETMLRHSIIELAYFDFVKSITLVYPWDIREIDYQYLKSIIPNTVLAKFKIVSGNIIDFLKSKKESNITYTTIISNSIDDVNEMIDNCKEYNTNTSFFLLRNHSGNTVMEFSKDCENSNAQNIEFKEVGTVEIYNKLMDTERLVPKTQMQFARYEPMLFDDAKPRSNDLNVEK